MTPQELSRNERSSDGTAQAATALPVVKPLPSLDYVPPSPPKPQSYSYLCSVAPAAGAKKKGKSDWNRGEGEWKHRQGRRVEKAAHDAVADKVWRWPADQMEARAPQAVFMDHRGLPVIYDVGRRSYAFHWPGAFPPDASDLALEKLASDTPWEELTNKRGVVTRKSCFVSGLGGGRAASCTCAYQYGDTSMPSKSVPFLERITQVLFGNLFPDLPAEQRPTCANINLYENGDHSCGWHADDEKLFGDGSTDVTIVSLSLGASREFWLALRKSPRDVNPRENSVIEVDLNHGDVFTMEGLCQKHTLHMVPRAGAAGCGPRINVTWRWVRQHQSGCPLPAQAKKTLASRDVARFLEPRDFSPAWCRGREVRWGVCSYCEHPGWKGGRTLIQTETGWLCRLCTQAQAAWAMSAWQQMTQSWGDPLLADRDGWPPGWRAPGAPAAPTAV